MQVEEMSAVLQATHRGAREYRVKSIKPFCKKKEFSQRISQDHVRAMISEAFAEVQKNFYKIYFCE